MHAYPALPSDEETKGALPAGPRKSNSPSRRLSRLEGQIGPRPELTLIVEGMFVREIWVAGRAPVITIHDYDWGETDPNPAFDADGSAFSPIQWRGPAWTLGLSLHPPAKETYTMANQKLKTIALSELKISKLNMRHSRKKPDVSDILPSIRSHGLRQSLLVREEGEHFGVVAGRRRLLALKEIAKETGADIKVPCIVMQAGDDAEAMEASILENIARLPATEMEQYVAFGRLSAEGRTPPEIADYFGITVLTVRRVLALANLSKPVRDLYACEEVDRATVRALTLATPEQQAEWLKLFNDDTQREPRGRNCKAWITGGTTITTDKALFELADYDGELITDLFEETGVFASHEAFWAAQSKALALRIEAYREKGWRDICVLERGHYFQTWENKKRARTRGGKVFVEVRHDGAVIFHEGYISNAEARKLERATRDNAADEKSIRPEMSAAMATYIAEHRRLAVSANLLDQPAIAHRLMVAHAIVGSGLWGVRAHHIRAKDDGVRNNIRNSQSAHVIDAAQSKVADMFKAHGVENPRQNADSYHLCEVFVALLGMSDEEVSLILTTTMVASLDAGTTMIEALAVATETDMAQCWQPDDVFFDLLRDKRAINAMVAEVASPNVAKECLTDTAKVQKEIIKKRISGDGCKANRDWRPAWMSVPSGGYVSGAPCPPADAWGRIESLLSSDETPSDASNNQSAVAA